MHFREAATTARISVKHPNQLVPVKNYGIEDDTPFMVMDLMLGGSLRDRMQNMSDDMVISCSDEDRIKEVCEKIAKGVAVLHSNGVIHQDLKPENILFAEEKTWDLRIADLGLAKIAESGFLTKRGVTAFKGGTMHYTPFAVINGDAKPNERTDIYSLGAILHELLTGNPPQIDPKKEMIINRKDLTDNAKDIIIRSCKLIARNTYSTTEQFIKALENADLTNHT